MQSQQSLPFDPGFYATIMNAANSILRNNINAFGTDFAQRFLNEFSYNANNNSNWGQCQALFNYVANGAMQMNNQFSVNDNQLFQLVSNFISGTFNDYRQRMQQQNAMQNRAPMGFGGNQNFGGGNPMMGGMNNNSFGRPPEPGSHLIDDTLSRPAAAAQTMKPMTSAPQPVAPAPTPMTVNVVDYASNPLDSLSDDVVFVNNIETNPRWGNEKAKDNRIVLGERVDFKARSSQHVIQGARGYHQQILNDPLDVVDDFFKIAPDSVVGSMFFYSIFYNHLDIIDVPTKDFIEVRQKCIDAVSDNKDVLLHRKLLDELKTMQQGSYEALTSYLLVHINRALYLSARLSDRPNGHIWLKDIKDLDELLSSSFQHPFVQIPEGRFKLEKIVGNTIWNVLVKNAGVMFDDEENIPTHAIQSSPVFPYSIEGVYPNKFAIPTPQEADADILMKRMQDKELNHRTYLLTRRRVVITNILGKNVLSQLSTTAKAITSPVMSIFEMSRCKLPFDDPNQTQLNLKNAVEPYSVEGVPGDQFQAYQDDPQTFLEEMVERFNRMPMIELPVDQTIFAVQYATSPMTYLAALDVFSTLDENKKNNTLIMKKKSLPSLKITDTN